jgi:hypothetical protein
VQLWCKRPRRPHSSPSTPGLARGEREGGGRGSVVKGVLYRILHSINLEEYRLYVVPKGSDSRDLPTGLGIDPRDLMPMTTSSKSIGGSSIIARSRSFCRPRPKPIWVPKDRSGTHPCGVAVCPGAMQGVAHLLPFGIVGCQVTSLAGRSVRDGEGLPLRGGG